METSKKICIKLFFVLAVGIGILISLNKVSAFEIKHYVTPKDELNSSPKYQFPEMIYRKQVSAYDDTIKKYKNGTYPIAGDGWVYSQDLSGNYPTDNSYTGINNTNHDNKLSFERVYEYFHQYQNSGYTTEYSDDVKNAGLVTRYYTSGQLKSTDLPVETPMSTKRLWNVWGETNNYAGVYWVPASSSQVFYNYDLNQKQDILIMNSNLYRFAVVNDVYVSDNYFSEGTQEKLWEKFGTNNSSKELLVYVSSVLRTSSANAKNGEPYYQNMDTTYKFWETTVRGGLAGNWVKSPSTMGTDWDGNEQPARSAVNYYDNTLVVPKGNVKKIYVRHIDVSGLTNFTSSDINNSMIIRGINNGQIIEVESTEKNGKLWFSQYRWPLSARMQTYDTDTEPYCYQQYNEKYELNPDNKNWIVGNIKYNNTDSYVNSSGQSVAVSYLNGGGNETEQKIINSYNCVGGSIGYGDSLTNAIVNRDNNLNSNQKFGGGDWANQYINGSNQYDYIVIDFYYEKKPTEIYVRHIDITDETNITDGYLDQGIQTDVGRAFQLNNNAWEYSIGSKEAEREVIPTNSIFKYQEHYSKPSNEILRIANIKYDHDTAGSYWDLLSDTQRNTTYRDYTCVGAVVGMGDRIDLAEVNKAQVKTNNNVNTKVDFVNKKAEDLIGNAYQYISKNSDYTSIVVSNNNYNVVVIDFYYEKKTTDIYVRHIDITDETNITDNYLDKVLQTNKGKAFLVNSNSWENFIGSKQKTNNSNFKPSGSSLSYQEHYTKGVNEILRIANIKYDHDTAGSYWDLLEDGQKNTYSDYVCVGAAVGKAATIRSAEEYKANVKSTNNVNTKANFVNKASESLTGNAYQFISKNYNWTSVVVNNNDYKVVVIDFYYIKDEGIPEETRPPERKVYVRHIDMTGKTVNYTNVQKAIAEGNVLTGTGKAQRLDNNTYINKNSTVPVGYQECFTMPSGVELKINKDSNLDYNCIGSNITASTVNLSGAQTNMDDSRLRSGLYSTSGTNKEYRKTTDVNNTNVAILIDFYYTSKHTGTPIDRPTKGRLAFYTLDDANSALISGDSSTNSNINNPTTSDSATVYDVIASGESLKLSVDNAYVYMLGGINIKEQKIQDTYSFNYTITQNYTVNYLDWYGECSAHGIQTDDISNTNSNYYCYVDVWVGEECVTSCDSEGNCSEECTDIYEDCGNTLSLKTSLTSTTGSISRTFTYQIPYEYTFYKVKNMRIYTISKIELLDGYENNGLPLFDGQTHEIYPTTTYDNSFSSSNSTFTQSKNNQSPNRTTDTLDTTLVYYYNNQNGDVIAATARTDAQTNINTMFNNITHSLAAEMKDFDVTSSSSATDPSGTSRTTNYTYEGIKENTTHNRLYMKFYVKNDEASFTDKVKNRNIKIVGEGTDLSNRAKSSGDSSNEMNAVKFVDLVEYTKNKTRQGTGTTYTYNVNTETDRISITTQYPKSIRGTSDDATGSQYLPTNYLTSKTYFDEEALKIPETRLNGKRYSYGKIYYNLLETTNNKLNFDANDNGTVACSESNKSTCHDWNNNSGRKAVSGGGNKAFVDTEMYNKAGVANPEKTTLISPSSLGEVEMEYGKNNNSTINDADIVDVFTPISFAIETVTGQASGSQQVDHTTTNKNNNTTTQIQKNSRFTIAMEPTSANSEYDNLDTDKYLMQYYIKFDFDVQDIKIYDAKNKNGRNYDVGSVSAGNWIGPIYNQYGSTNLSGAAKISAFALADPNQATTSSIVNQETNSYEVRAVAYNASSSLLYDLARGNTTLNSLINKKEYNSFSGPTSTSQSHQQYYDQNNIYGHSNYVAELKVETENLSRVYDFKVTDLKDLDWKDIFRTSTSTSTNVHTSEAYYSGIKKWNVYTTQSNQLLTRDASEIGSTKQQILPLGPYKNTNTTYIKAPKLGYKFSFDLKTTGSISESDGVLKANKKVVITPSFYYISKDPDPSNPNKPIIIKEVDLYYKNSSNKYVSIDNYNLYFVPDDGYRLTFEGTDAAYRFYNSSLSKSTIKLGNAKKLTLTTKMMEQADNMFVQIWYGEYKLPNSTIAVKRGDDINNKLTDGYIGVKFDIQVIEYNSATMIDSNIKRILNYNQKDNNASGNNTTQWDYEGYLGYDYTTKNGANLAENGSDNIRLALEGMSWNLKQDDYEFIKGTVILYDTDAKASSDYD